jgi:hypothetical protein
MKPMNQRMVVLYSQKKHYLLLYSRFTVHGFRYIVVFDPPMPMTIDDVECPFVHSETTLKGHFASSNPIINQIQHNILWGQLSNIMSVPTDWLVLPHASILIKTILLILL